MFVVAHEFFPPGGGKMGSCSTCCSSSTLFGLNVVSEGASPGCVRPSIRLLATLLVLLETEAGPAAQFPLLLGKVFGSRSAGPRL